MAKYIYQHKDWNSFTYSDAAISSIFGEVRNLQGRIAGQMNAIGFSAREEAALSTVTLDVVKSSQIEGEILNYEQVRSSVARHLGIDLGGFIPIDKHIDGVVAMMLDATQNYQNPLTQQRLLGWHSALFPTGYSGMLQIEVGSYRSGEMQIVSGGMGKEKIHYEAIPPALLNLEMGKFLDWVNADQNLDPVLKAAIAHFWFIIIHPFGDGNGRIARAISDMLLARAEASPERFYSMSSQILVERKRYYEVLQKVQHSNGDITEWLDWSLQCLKNALLETDNTLHKIFRKASFWKFQEATPLNDRQRIMLNKLLGGFEGKLRSSKWAKIAKCSPDTALRDIKDLIEKRILRQEQEGGRSTNYELVEF
ncbi:MAG: Fic family protein [Saprospiraceae bacterium]